MNKLDAIKVLNLSGDLNPSLIKAAYRKACSLYHPDRNPAGTEMMKAVNEAYEVLKDFEGNLEGSEQNYGEELNDALNSIYSLDGLDIEICGSWVWVTGDTKTHKEALKEAGFKWARQKKAWYLRPEGDKRRYRGNCTLDEIREKHGSKKAKFNRKSLAA